jgi:hypothetical protein
MKKRALTFVILCKMNYVNFFFQDLLAIAGRDGVAGVPAVWRVEPGEQGHPQGHVKVTDHVTVHPPDSERVKARSSVRVWRHIYNKRSEFINLQITISSQVYVYVSHQSTIVKTIART